MTMPTILVRAGSGAVGGVLGTLFMHEAMQVSGRLPEPLRPPTPRDDPGHFIVSRAEDVAGTALSQPVRSTAAQGLHWAYGISWGTLLGLAAPSIGVHSWPAALAAGGAMGALCWSAGYLGWLPAAGLVEPIHRQGASHALSALATHVVYGVLCAVPMFAIHRAVWRRRRRALARLFG